MNEVGRTFTRIRNAYGNWRYGRIDPAASIGRRGELYAARMLRQKGLVVVAHSESDRAGEIDLIAIDRRHQTMIFVEVKALATLKPGHPADHVDHDKQRRISHAALRYLKRKRLLGVACRFDVIAIWWPEDWDQPEHAEHYEAAFETVES